MRFCGNFNAILSAADEDRLLVTRVRCKQWNCPYCGLINTNQWRARAINGVNNLPAPAGWYFATITSHERAKKYARSLENLRGGFERLYFRLRRAAGRKVHYLRIYEHHQDGELHIHALLNYPVTKKWLKDKSRECGMGYQCDIRPIENTGIASWYVTKYLTKSIAGKEMPKHIRRINTSHGWPALPPGDKSELTWEIGAAIPEEKLYTYREIYDLSEGRALDSDDFWDYGMYPPRAER